MSYARTTSFLKCLHLQCLTLYLRALIQESTNLVEIATKLCLIVLCRITKYLEKIRIKETVKVRHILRVNINS